MELPETMYADAGGVRIAYQDFGSGPRTLCLVTNWASNIEAVWQLEEWADFVWRLARDLRVLIFDHRGTGSSDRVPRALTAHDQARDIRAVLDAAQVDEAVLLGVDTATAPVLSFAALHPERTSKVILIGAAARLAPGDGYPHGVTDVASTRDVIVNGWGVADSPYNEFFLPGERQRRRRTQMARIQRLAIDPSEARGLVEHWFALDARATAPAVTAPTLLLHSIDDPLIPIEHGRWLAEQLPDARLEEVQGDEHLLYFDHRNLVVTRALHFLLGDTATAAEQTVVALVMTDIVGSTELAHALGAERWAEVIGRHDTAVRRLLARYGGDERTTAGDSFFATFSSVGSAVRFGLDAAAAATELDLQLRVGVHVADVDDRSRGFGVHVAARVQAAAGPDEVLVSGGVRDGLVGVGDLDFASAGEHVLKGVPGSWPLWRARR